MTDNLDAVRAALDLIEEPIDEYDPGWGGGGYDGGDRPFKTMPEGCPVIPVGTEQGVYYFINALGELISLVPDKISNRNIVALFSPHSDFLEENWPAKKLVAVKGPDGKPLKDANDAPVMEEVVTGWATQKVTHLLMDVAGQRGVWNPREKVRGRGAWRADDGSLILHCGTRVLIDGRWMQPGAIGDMVYPTQPAIPLPKGEASIRAEELMPRLVGAMRARGMKVPGRASPAHFLLEMLKTWNWERKLVDPVLAIGWLAASRLGGALRYRPIAWVTGGRGTGKSELLVLIDGMFRNALLQSPSASEAGVRQVLGQQSLPVNLDESEAGKDNRKMEALVTLARLAATSQGNIIKGGQDHKATEFRATSCFLFTSILVPPLEPADKSRMALLELGKLPEGSESPEFEQYLDELAALGGWMLKRFADNWHRWPRMLQAWKRALADVGGQDSRAADQFGTLRAAAELMLSDEMPEDEELAMWADLLGVDALSETADAPEEGELCLSEIRSRQVNLVGVGPQLLVSEWILQATQEVKPSQMDFDGSEARERRAKAVQALGRIGIKPIRWNGRQWVAFATKAHGLSMLLQDTKYREGVWTQALARLPGAVKSTTNKKVLSFSGHGSKVTLVPLEVVLPPTIGDEDEEAADAETEPA